MTASLTEALRRNADALLAYFERRVVPSSEAGDLLAETMLQAWRRAEKAPTNETETRMWLFGIAGNVALNHSRGRRRRNALANKLRQVLDRRPEPDPAEAIACAMRSRGSTRARRSWCG